MRAYLLGRGCCARNRDRGRRVGRIEGETGRRGCARERSGSTRERETARTSSVRAQVLRLTAEGQFLLSSANDERALLELVAAARMARASEIDSALLSALLARRDMLRLINTRQGSVVSVAVTPDGRRLVSGGADGTLRLWDAQTGQPIGDPLTGHKAR